MFRPLLAFLTGDRDFGRIKDLVRELAVPTAASRLEAELRTVFLEPRQRVRTKDEAIEELTALLVKRRPIVAVLAQHGFSGPAAQRELIALYWVMLLARADNSIGGTFVAAASLCDSELVAQLLEDLRARGNGTRLEDIAYRQMQRRGVRIARP